MSLKSLFCCIRRNSVVFHIQLLNDMLETNNKDTVFFYPLRFSLTIYQAVLAFLSQEHLFSLFSRLTRLHLLSPLSTESINTYVEGNALPNSSLISSFSLHSCPPYISLFLKRYLFHYSLASQDWIFYPSSLQRVSLCTLREMCSQMIPSIFSFISPYLSIFVKPIEEAFLNSRTSVIIILLPHKIASLIPPPLSKEQINI